MQQFVIHGESAPSISLTQVLLDGVHYGTYQVGFGYGDCNSYGPGTQVLKQFHDTITPSINLTKVTLDGTHNGTYQIGLGCLELSAVLNDTGTIGKFLGSVLSFIGYSIRKLNSTFMVPFTGVLGTIGAFLKSTIRPISEPGIGFRSDFFANPSTIQTIQIFFSSLLNLTTVSTKRDRPIFAATLTLNGFFQRFKVKLLTAVIAFVGAFTKRTRKIIAGLVQFTTSFSSGGKLFTANLNFTGVSTRLRGKIFSPVLSFIGVIKKFSPRTLPSSLSFTARIFHSIPTFIQSLTAALPFSGFFATGRKFFKSNTAVISFIGSITRFRAKILIATLSFAGTVRKSTLRSITATISLIGIFTRFRPLLVLLTSSLSFVGSFIRGRLFQSALSFIGDFSKFAPFVHLSSALSFVGITSKKSPKSFAATLSLIGNLIRVKPFLKIMTAVISFIGSFSRFKPIRQLLTASLSFVGNVSKIVRRQVSGTLSFIGTILIQGPRTILMASVLSFVASKRNTTKKSFPAVLRLRGFKSGLFYSFFVTIIQYVRTAVQTVLGRVQSEYRTPELIQPLRTIQTIGTTVQLIDLSDFTFPPPCLFIKNTDNTHFIEIDSVNTFNAFPQKIPPEHGLLLSPNTTTMYARALGAPVDILLSPGVPERIYHKRLDSSLRFSGTLPGFLPPITTLYVRFFVMFDQPESTTALPQATVIDFFRNRGAFDTDLLFSFWPDFSTDNFVLGSPSSGEVQELGSLTYREWFQVDLKIEILGGNITVTLRMFDADYGSLTVPGTRIGSFSFGARYNGTLADRYLDNLQLGTHFAGDSNIFTANFSSLTIVPPFDSISGPGVSIVSGLLPDGTYSLGSMFVNNAGEQSYAVKNL